LLDLPAGTRVAVAMSGGVDSSVVAGLLAEAGYDVVGFTARLYDVPRDRIGAVKKAGTCCAPEDARDARSVARSLGIRHYVLDEREAFENAVIAPFVDDWQTARTPNPCVECNRTLKFERLAGHARAIGAQVLATGHYARLDTDEDGRPRLRSAVDGNKDQAYFLYPLKPEMASFLRFPLGGMTKDEVRKHAERLDLPVADKPESMDICFTAGRDPAGFVGQRSEPIAGKLVDVSGMSLGKHTNLAKFTVGQRRGLGISTAAEGGGRRFVLDKNTDGTVIVGPRELLKVESMDVGRFTSVTGQLPQVGDRVGVQVRHRQRPIDGVVSDVTDDRLELTVSGEMMGAARGQSAVLWSGDRIVGGGIIEDVVSGLSRTTAAAQSAGAAAV